MTSRGRSQDTNKGHIGRPVLLMSPGSGGGSTASIKWEEPRDCTWPDRMSPPPDASEVECISFYQLLWGARGLHTAELGTRRPWPQTRWLCLSHALWVFFQLMTGHLRSRRTECVFFVFFFNSLFHSDQLMENRLRRPPRISSDLQVREAGKCCPAPVPGTGLDTGAGKGPAAAYLDTGTQPGLSDSVFNGVKSTWFVYFSFNLGHFVSLSENVT